MKRREFLAAVGALGYSVVVKADPADDRPQVAPPEDLQRRFDQIAPATGPVTAEPHMTTVELRTDVFIAGGGMAGVCAALAAARNGAKVVLVQDRSRLGGNSSSEVKMHIVGADNHTGRPGWREGGILEELRLDDAVNNPQRCWELWDLLLYDKCISEKNITLLLDTTIYRAEVAGGRITAAWARCDKTEHLYRVVADIYCDCTGDSRLALEAGAEMRHGRESREQTHETMALEQPDSQTLGSSVLFTARDCGRPMPYQAPKWARKIAREQLRFRPITSFEYGYWWIEWGGALNTIRDNERIRFELLAIVTGVWDYIKNSGAHPNSANWAMDWVGMAPGKREARRIIGDYILQQDDLTGINPPHSDGIAIGGWNLDNHPPGGFDDWKNPPFTSIRLPAPYNIPFRCVYAKDVSNLMMAGRNISQTHVAFTSARVMATCAVLGQAAGTAAAVCALKKIEPRTLANDSKAVERLQQRLLRDDQTIKGLANADPDDLARKAKVSASSHVAGADPEHVINGLVRDESGRWDNRWAAEMSAGDPSIELTWENPQRISHVQITFDSGFHRQLTLSSSDSVSKSVIRAPQPETVRDYTLSYLDEGKSWIEIGRFTANHQRLCRHSFAPVMARAIRLTVHATNGDPKARIYEIRCYSDASSLALNL